MVPWPIALLSVFYGLIATVSAATAWKIAAGGLTRPVVWPMAWLALSASLMVGLPLLKPWARRLAIVGSALLALVMLSLAGLLVMAGRPLSALAAALGAGVHVVTIRYLQRPLVRLWFAKRCPTERGAWRTSTTTETRI